MGMGLTSLDEPPKSNILADFMRFGTSFVQSVYEVFISRRFDEK